MSSVSSRSAKSEHLAGVILAAGEGKRVGRNKALLEVEDGTSLERVVTCMLSAGCDPVIVVGGAEASSVREEAFRLGVRFALNSNWRNGQFSSLKTGMSELAGAEGSKLPSAEGSAPASAEGSDLASANGSGRASKRGPKTAGVRGARLQEAGAIVALVDLPFVKKETYQVLVRTSQRFPERIIIPTHHDRRGHPVVVPREVMTAIIGAPDGMTLRDIMRKHDNLVLEQAVDDAGILKDIDTEADLKSDRQRERGGAG
jgi:CTP:molybdopterin cytidylyltransferase MocA